MPYDNEYFNGNHALRVNKNIEKHPDLSEHVLLTYIDEGCSS